MNHSGAVFAKLDRALEAVVLTRRPLYYDDGADPSVDRPAHVRAGSSIAWVPGGIALVQDDANFIAVVDPNVGRARWVALPEGAGGRRQFDDRRGNKRHKLDLEACVSADTADGVILIALGSGSTPGREQVVIARGWESGRPAADLVHVPALYDRLRRAAAFAGSELNVEGAIRLGDRLRLFGRGNGARRGDVVPVNASCDLGWSEFLDHLRDVDRAPPPEPATIVRYELGTMEGVPLSFTDATLWRDAILFSATAEESPDVTRDGRVHGSAIGIIGRSGSARWAPLSETSGSRFPGKVEGLVAAQGPDSRIHVVVDADDPDAASELCTVELRGDWPG
jgi:hypothetical protein